MKTTYIKSLVGLILFLWGNLAHSQNYWYMGGVADGSASESVISNTCSAPFHFYAYMGGNADGAAVETIENSTCSTPYHFYAYMGGNADGAAVETVENNICSTPYHFFAYFGGNADGSAFEKIQNCPIVLPVADFTGTPTTICAGQEVQFTSTSTNALAYEWTFPGGTLVTPSTLTSQNPKVKYFTAGSYAVTLKVRNMDGTDTKTVSGYILVSAIPPAISNTAPGSRCGAGSVTLGATPSFGTVEWYANSSGGTALGTGNTWNTPNISTNTTYYAQAINGTCISTSRTAVVATIINTPAPTGTANQYFCSGETINNLMVSGSNIQWYDSSSGGNLLPSSTPLVGGNTYYATQTANSCESSSRFAVTVVMGSCLSTTEAVKSDLKVYPIPVSEILNIEDENEILKIELYAPSGQKVLERKVNNKKFQLDVHDLPQTMYILRVFIDKEVKIVKITKK